MQASASPQKINSSIFLCRFILFSINFVFYAFLWELCVPFLSSFEVCDCLLYYFCWCLLLMLLLLLCLDAVVGVVAELLCGVCCLSFTSDVVRCVSSCLFDQYVACAFISFSAKHNHSKTDRVQNISLTPTCTQTQPRYRVKSVWDCNLWAY